jgi:proteic killer suppression protein
LRQPNPQVVVPFGSDDTERLWRRERVPSLDPRMQRVALRKLRQVGWAEALDEPRVPLGNMLEQLKGDRYGRHSIRINDQWRISFLWTDAGPEEIEIVDCH